MSSRSSGAPNGTTSSSATSPACCSSAWRNAWTAIIQKYIVEPGSYTRKHFFGKYPELLELVTHLSDEQISKLLRGGHDVRKVYAAYKSAMEHKGQPTVILAKTVKGYGLGEAGEGKNISHQQKKMNEKELREFRARFDIPLSDDVIADMPFYRPPADSPEMKYLLEQRKKLGGFLPARIVKPAKLDVPTLDHFAELFKAGRTEISTTIAFGSVVEHCCSNIKVSNKHLVPIIPDEARTFGLDALFREIGIYSSKGQLYEPVDSNTLSYYHEAKDGQILEEGISETGAMSSFIAAGTSYATHGVPMVPFYIYYSMFGPQRVGDLFWLAGDIRAKGFLLGATSGRTTLNGEGLQHQDGHSLLARQHDCDLPALRSGVRLRTRGHRRRWFAPDVCGERGYFLLPRASITKIIPCPRCPPVAKTAS